jgi:signal transduction histidine kinase
LGASAEEPRVRADRLWSSFEARFVENPAYLSVLVRWITCAVAAIVVATGAAPAANLDHAAVALFFVVAWCAALTLGPFVQRQKPLPSTAALGSAADLLFSGWIIFITGGFRSPFYEFALTSVIAPSLLFRMRGALLSGTAFCALYFLAVWYSPQGFQAAIRNGETDGTLFSSITNPYTIGIFCALLGAVVTRLREARERARDLAAAEERSRIAREIHDGIAQRMFMLTLNLETCAELSRRAMSHELTRMENNETAKNAKRLADLESRLDGLMKMSKQALLEVRHYIFDVKPLLEGKQTLSDSLRSQIKEFEAVSGMRVDFEVRGEESAVDVGVRSALFRIVQEAMANAYKHAKSEEVCLRITFSDEAVAAEIEDRGAGFDPDSSERRTGIGLDGMRQRAEEGGGRLSLSSAPGRGTTVSVSMPRAPCSHGTDPKQKAKERA